MAGYVHYCPKCQKLCTYDNEVEMGWVRGRSFLCCKHCHSILTNTGVNINDFEKYSSEGKEALVAQMRKRTDSKKVITRIMIDRSKYK